MEERVARLMRKGAITCGEEASIRKVAQVMAVNSAHYCVVINQGHEILGIISTRSILRAYGRDLDQTSAKDILLPHTVTITPNTDIGEGIRLMDRLKIEHVIVTADRPGSRAVLGMLHAEDIVDKMVQNVSAAAFEATTAEAGAGRAGSPIRVCDLMDRRVIVCNLDDSVSDVVRIMKANQFCPLAVVDQTGEVWGLVSRLAVIRFYGKDLDQISAEDVMRPYKFEVNPQSSIESAIGLMKRTGFEHLIVIDPHAGPKRPIGILSSFNIVWYMSHIETGHYEHILKMPEGR